MQPTSKLFEVARAMFKDAWAQRLSQAKETQALVKKQLRDVEKQIEDVLDRIMDASSASIISAYEARLEKLERQRLVLTEKAASALPKNGQLEKFIELSLKFLSRPCNIYKNGSYDMKQTVLRLAFAGPLTYHRIEGYRTPETSFPFKVLGNFNTQKSQMVL